MKTEMSLVISPEVSNLADEILAEEFRTEGVYVLDKNWLEEKIQFLINLKSLIIIQTKNETEEQK